MLKVVPKECSPLKQLCLSCIWSSAQGEEVSQPALPGEGKVLIPFETLTFASFIT